MSSDMKAQIAEKYAKEEYTVDDSKGRAGAMSLWTCNTAITAKKE